MNKATTIVLIILIVITSLMLMKYVRFNSAMREVKISNFNKQLGVYILDLERTNMGSYKQDSEKYRNLQIAFYKDSTFKLNMKVPFLFDSIGSWIAGGPGLEEWNRLFFKSWPYSTFDKNSGSQFTQPWTSDSIFYINGAIPQIGQDFVQEIYFKKLPLN